MAFDEIKALRKAIGEMTGVKNPDAALKKRIEYNIQKLHRLEKASKGSKSLKINKNIG